MVHISSPTIILGGGFVGLFTALHLGQQNYFRPIILIEQGDRTVSVELLLDAAVTAITPKGVEYQQQGKAGFLPSMTIVWTGGTTPHSLLETLAVAPENRNQRGQLEVTPTWQLADFPEVFVGGDCAFVTEQPQPPTAQVAYQQGKAIEVKGELGHLIRQGTYLELLPTPIYNFKKTAEWFTDGLLQRHQPQSIHPQKNGRTPLLAGMTATLASVMIASPLIWRAALS